MKTVFSFWAPVVFAAVLTACPVITETTPKPQIVSFTATPQSLPSGGGSVTLAWNVTGATSLSVDSGVGAVTGTSKAVTVTASTTFTLTATNAGGSSAMSAAVTVSPSAPTALYADPVSGQDSNPGTIDKPFKTIKQALAAVTGGQTIVLYAGIYNAASGETFNYSVPNGVTIKANSSGVVLQGSASQAAFEFLGAASVQYLTLKGFGTATATATNGTGDVSLLGLHFQSLGLGGQQIGLWHSSNGEVQVKDCVFEGPHKDAIIATGQKDGSIRPKLVVQGGSITGSIQAGINIDHADLTISNLEEKNAGYGLYMNNAVSAVVTGVKFGPNSIYAIATYGDGNTLKVRNSQFLNNQAAIYAEGDFLEIDLGQSDTVDAGGNAFKGSTSYAIWADNTGLAANRTIYAAGNQWEANIQGSDANGHFKNSDPPVCSTSKPAPGLNYRINVTDGKPQLCLKL